MAQEEIWYNISEKLPEVEGLYLVSTSDNSFKRMSTFKNGKFSVDNVTKWCFICYEKERK